MDFFAKFRTAISSRGSALQRTAVPEVRQGAREFTHGFRSGQPVTNSEDLRRILSLPRRARPDTGPLVAKWTDLLGAKRSTCSCKSKFGLECALTLRPVQAWALEEISTVGGLAGPIGVGDGKTLLDLLAPMALGGCRVAMLLIPTSLKAQLLEKDWEYYSQHWKLPNLTSSGWVSPGRPYLHIVSFDELSHHTSTDLMDRINPDLVVVDEAHNLANPDAARTRRFIRFVRSRPTVRVCLWSGTFSKKAIRENAHLFALALGDQSPAPIHPSTVKEWSSAIDKDGHEAAPIGALVALCDEGEHVREAYRRRKYDTPGVVTSLNEVGCDATLIIEERPVAVPSTVGEALKRLEKYWQRPDGEELVSALDKARCAYEVSSGFFYRWRWPRGEPDVVIARWLEVRKEWHRELREKLQNSREFMDSPLLCANAAMRFEAKYRGPLPVWRSQWWAEWAAVKDSARPETEAVWIDDFLLKNAAAWGQQQSGIVWYRHDEFGRRLAQMTGFPWYGPGAEASEKIIFEKGDRTILASIRVHGTGKNLQMFSRQLVANPPADGAEWQQLLGRTHRPGQKADEVRVSVYRHTAPLRQAFETAYQRARYILQTEGGKQKLLQASIGFVML